MVGKVALKKTLSILAGPIGWVITGALVGINLAWPAYRVTVPACVLVATLRRKPKQTEPKIDNKKGGKEIFIFIFLVILIIVSSVIFSSKENTIQAMTQAITQKAVLKTLKTLATRIKEW